MRISDWSSDVCSSDLVSGVTPVHGELFGLEGQLRAEVLAQVIALGHERLWLEKVKLATRAPVESDTQHDSAEALADLRVLLDQAKADSHFLEGLQSELMGLVGKAPQELQGSVPWFDDIRAGDMSRLLDEVGRSEEHTCELQSLMRISYAVFC